MIPNNPNQRQAPNKLKLIGILLTIFSVSVLLTQKPKEQAPIDCQSLPTAQEQADCIGAGLRNLNKQIQKNTGSIERNWSK